MVLDSSPMDPAAPTRHCGRPQASTIHKRIARFQLETMQTYVEASLDPGHAPLQAARNSVSGGMSGLRRSRNYPRKPLTSMGAPPIARACGSDRSGGK